MTTTKDRAGLRLRGPAVDHLAFRLAAAASPYDPALLHTWRRTAQASDASPGDGRRSWRARTSSIEDRS